MRTGARIHARRWACWRSPDVVERLRERGHWVTRTGHNDSFDLLVSGLRVEVKAATWSGRWRRYQANPRSNEADVLILGCQNGRMHYFVIPFEQVRGLRNIAIWSEDPEQYSGRWRAYLERWELIEELIGRGVNHWQRPLVTVDGESWADGDADCGI